MAVITIKIKISNRANMMFDMYLTTYNLDSSGTLHYD